MLITRTKTGRSALLKGFVPDSREQGERVVHSCADSSCAYRFRAVRGTRKVCPKCERARVRELQ
jgi:hypothetical protein